MLSSGLATKYMPSLDNIIVVSRKYLPSYYDVIMQEIRVSQKRKCTIAIKLSEFIVSTECTSIPYRK